MASRSVPIATAVSQSLNDGTVQFNAAALPSVVRFAPLTELKEIKNKELILEVIPSGFSSERIARGRVNRTYTVDIISTVWVGHAQSNLDLVRSDMAMELLESIATHLEKNTRMAGAIHTGLDAVELPETFDPFSALEQGVLVSGISSNYIEHLEH